MKQKQISRRQFLKGTALAGAAALLTACSTPATTEPTATAQNVATPTPAPVTLEYWQVEFANYDDAINAVITLFKDENPNVTVNVTDISYDDINEKIAVSVPVGQGPDLVNPFFGWVPLWAKSGFLAPLPEEMFPKQTLADTYLPAVNAMYYDDQLWGLPLNQSSWAILYNKDMFAEAGITTLPTTWPELREAALATTKRDSTGKLEVAGYFVSFGTQEHILWKVLCKQNGQPLFSADEKTVTWNDTPTGEAAFQWVADMIKVDKVIDVGFADDSPGSAFYTAQTAMRLGSPSNLPVIRSNAPDLNFGSFQLPKGTASDPNTASQNQSQYWSFNMTSQAAKDVDTNDASLKFMSFLMKPEASMAYIKILGGLPVHKSLKEDSFFTSDVELGPFMATLDNANPLFWVDEKGERQLVLDMADKVLLNDEDPVEVFNWGTEQEQQLRDTFFEA
jgi:multiple sugar transport system substrate-binding protein